MSEGVPEPQHPKAGHPVCMEVMDQWGHALPSQALTCQPGTASTEAGLAPDRHQDKGSSVRGTEEWRQVQGLTAHAAPGPTL